MTSFYELDLPESNAIEPDQQIWHTEPDLQSESDLETQSDSGGPLNEIVQTAQHSESSNELSNFAQSFFYSSIQRPVSAGTQIVNEIFPGLLPELELIPPPSSGSVGGFLGDGLGNFVDLLLINKWVHAGPLPFKSESMAAGLTFARNAILTPVNLQDGESFWTAKANQAGLGLIAGTAGRYFMGKGLPGASSSAVDLVNIGTRSTATAIGNAFFPGGNSVYKPGFDRAQALQAEQLEVSARPNI